MVLEKESETYKTQLPSLVTEEGKFVLIHGSELVGVYDTYDDALKYGYTKFQLEPFMVKQIHAIKQMQFVSRFVEPEACHAILHPSSILI